MTHDYHSLVTSALQEITTRLQNSKQFFFPTHTEQPWRTLVIPKNGLTLKFVSAMKQRNTLRLVLGHSVEPKVLLTMQPRYGLPLTVILSGAKDL